MLEFEVLFKEDKILVKREEVLFETGYTLSGLDNYYEMILNCERNEMLPERVIERELYTVSTFKDVCFNCHFKDMCSEYDLGSIDYKEFFNKSKQLCEVKND
jgi:hypothetical protein